MEDETEYLKLPVEDRCQHKLWKARVNGYEAAVKLFHGIREEKDPEWSKYLGLVKKFVVDSNAVAQEKGLEAVLAYVENAGCAGKTCGEVVSGVVAKCLGAPKVKTKERGMEIVMMYIEIERQEIVQDELLKGLESKTPKVVSACIQVLKDALHDFGPRVITLKPLVKKLPSLLEDRDKGVRDEAKTLTVEIYRWIGTALKPQLASLKPVQLTELESEFQKVASERAVPTRYLRSQQEMRERAGLKDSPQDGDGPADNEGEDENDGPIAVDPYELMEPVDILSKLPKDFYERVEAKKWQERKEVVELLQPLTANPKLESGDYGDLVRALKKIIAKDTNVMVVALAGKCLAGIASGLKKRFQPYASQCFSVVLEKFKEKKQNVVLAMREAADAMFLGTNFDTLQDDLLQSLDNKNPSVKSETAAFMARSFAKCDSIVLNKKLLKLYCPVLLKILINDPDPVVRDSAAEALGTAMKVVGEPAIVPLMQELDALKMGKVKEFCEKAEVVKVKAAPKSKVTMVAKKPSPNETSKPVTSAAARKPIAGAPTSAAVKKVPAKSAGRTGKPSAASADGGATQEIVEKELSPEDIDDILSERLPAETVTGLADVNWKTRLSAVEQLSEALKTMGSDVPTQALVHILARRPGFKDNNFQVLKLKLITLRTLAEGPSFSRCSAAIVLDDLAEKLSDPKNGTLAAEALTAIAEATKLDYVATQVLDVVFALKNPKSQSEAMNWLTSAIKDFGFAIQPKPTIENIKKALAATNPAVRTSAVALLGTMYMYMGMNLRVFFESEKTALLQQIDAEFEKLKGVKPPAPTRGLAPEDKGAKEENGCSTAIVQTFNPADLIPRTDISGQLTPTLLSEMSDKNWKVRLEALQRLAAIVNEAKFIEPNLGDLTTVLRSRMTDSNKNLAMQALNICQDLGTGMGQSCSRHVRMLAPAMMTSLGDSKNTVRSAAASCLSAWVEQCGIAPFFEGEMVNDALKIENPNLRAELLGWLSERMPKVKPLPAADLLLILPLLFTALEDRCAEVRKKAQDAILPFMIHLGYEAMARCASKAKPGSKTLIMTALDKAKTNLPAKPVPPPSKAVRGGGGKSLSPPGANGSKEESFDNSSEGSPQTNPRGPQRTAKGAANRAPSKTRVATATKSTTTKRKDDDGDGTPALPANNLKDQRFLDEQRLKVLKWNFVTPRDEFYELLSDLMAVAGFNRTLLSHMFHNDFKFHIKAIDTLQECLASSPEATVANLDLILKWMALRFFDTNPSVLLKGLEYLQGLFHVLAETSYQMHEIEATSFVPYLILKVGDPKDPVRHAVRAIFRLLYRIYPANKMFLQLMEGLKSKNVRQRTECLEELGFMIESYGMIVCQPSPPAALREVARHISDRDNGVRNAALNCIVQAFFLDGEKVFKFVGPISDKDRGLLEERLKRASKNRPPTVPALQVVEQLPQVTQAPSPEKVTRQTTVREEYEEKLTVMRRANTARATTGGRRPVSGAFSLDLEKMEQALDEKFEFEMPKLVKLDIDDIINEPVRFPETKMRPPSPATKILNTSQDAASAMDLVISQVASNSARTSLQALAQLDEFLKEEGRAEAMVSRVDQLLVAVSLQYRVAYAHHMGDESTNKEDVVRLYRCLTMTLVSLFSHDCLAKRVSKDVLHDLIQVLVTILLDPRLANLSEGAHVVRAINVLVIKMVERSDHTAMMLALIRMLHECVAHDGASTKFTELVMKCLWKMVRLLQSIIDHIDLDRVFLELHRFLKEFPSAHWKGRSNDLPLRTVKTILHTLAKLKGNKVMSHLSQIDDTQESEIEPYLQKVLKGGVRHRNPAAAEQQQQHLSATDLSQARHSPRRLSKTTQEMLADIFKKIGSKETTKEGLVDLYAFKKRYPEADIEPFLSRSSQFFQSYIERGLHAIDLEREGKSTGTTSQFQRQSQLSSSTGSIPTTVAPSCGMDVDEPASVYLERLKLIRAQIGLPDQECESESRVMTNMSSRSTLSKAVSSSSNAESKSQTERVVVKESRIFTSTTSYGIPHSSSSEGLSSIVGGGGNMEDLRRRLERIKNAAKT